MRAPGQGMPPGINYLYPPKHTMLHVILNGVLPYETPVQDMRFKIFLAPCNVTVKQLISLLGAGEGADDKCGVTECVELGYGRWGKGISVFRADGAKCDQTLEDIGWDAERGDTKKPVWLAVHKP
ncbi:MAG: hypothetical protein M1832_005931 [Thelocarpon impressellum]|nr:MAG: hypothetical protein M1832_005931 [Thelocarpon impressellum]